MKNKCQEGFTLIELLISFSIVSILLLGAAQLTLYSLQAKRTSDRSLESAELASDKLEYLKSLPFESEELAEGTVVEVVESHRRKDRFRQECTIYDFSGSIKKIEMECFSTSGVRRSLRLLLLYSRALGF